MDYAPLQQWVNNGLVRIPAVFQRGASNLTDYDPVMAGNVVPGEVDITDPGQLGRANLPSLHAQTNMRDPHVNDSSMPPLDTFTSGMVRVQRWVGLRGGQYKPFLYTDVAQREEEYVATTGVGQQPFGPAGAGQFDTELQEHGPLTVEEMQSTKGVFQPVPVKQTNWWRRLLMLPDNPHDPSSGRDERVIAQLGQQERGQDVKSEASVAIGNQFVIPDMRRTFDQPKDAPASVPRDATGTPLYDNAGYWGTAEPLQGSVHEVQTSHAYPSWQTLNETAVGSSGERVRAGVQYDIGLTRPSVMPHWFDFRPFDKWADDHNYAFKGQLRPRIIAQPPMVMAEPASDNRWAAGRRYTAPPAGMNPIAVQPNIDRQAPSSWDSQLYLQTPDNVDTRAAGWRL